LRTVSDKLARFIQRNLERYSPSFWAMEGKHHFNFFPELTSDNLVYLCPLCRAHHIFQKGNELFWSTEFTMDHYPPSSVGGKNKALVCKSCNNTLGSIIDSHLPSGLRARRFFERKGPMPMTLSVNKIGNYKLTGSFEDGKLSLKENHRNSNLMQVMKLAAGKMSDGGEPFIMNMRGAFPGEALVSKALLKAAFLQFFSWAGYDFAFSHTAKKIREVLNGTTDHPLNNQGVFGRVTGANLSDGVYALTTDNFPKSFFCHVTFTDPFSKQLVNNIVLIPFNTEKAWEGQVGFNKFLQDTLVNWTFLRYNNQTFDATQPSPYSAETLRLSR